MDHVGASKFITPTKSWRNVLESTKYDEIFIQSSESTCQQELLATNATSCENGQLSELIFQINGSLQEIAQIDEVYKDKVDLEKDP